MPAISEWQWPRGDQHFSHYGEWWEYQKKSRRLFVRAMRDLGNWEEEAPMLRVNHIDTVIDIGAHVGTWTLDLARDSQRVIAYEPLHHRLLAANAQTLGVKNVEIRPRLISDQEQLLVVTQNRLNSGDSGIGLEPDDLAEQTRMWAQPLDEFLHPGWVQGIKIDVQGHELEVLQGAAQTIDHHRPVLCVEFNRGNPPAEQLLRGWNYELREQSGKDWIWMPK